MKLREALRDRIVHGATSDVAARDVVDGLSDEEARETLLTEASDLARKIVMHRLPIEDSRRQQRGFGAGTVDLPAKGRWSLVAEISHRPSEWRVITAGGRIVALADCKVEDLEELAAQYERDADLAHTLAKRLRRLALELELQGGDRVSDLADETIEEVLGD